MMQFPLTVGKVRTRVLSAGHGDHHIFLVHGAGARADRWVHNLHPFAEAGYHVVAFDLPGHGLADKTGSVEHSTPGYASFVLDALDELGIDRAIGIGTSLGGHVVATAACRAPENFEALVLVGSIGLAAWGADQRRATSERLQTTTLDGVRKKLTTLVGPDHNVDPDWVLEEFLVNTSAGAGEVFALLGAYLRDSVDDDIVGERLGQIATELPVLLVWGRDDLAVPLEIAERAHAMIRWSELAVMDGAGHAPYLQKPDAFNRIVIDFLQRHSPM